MPRIAFLAAFLATFAARGATSPALFVEHELIPSPANLGAFGPQVARSSGGDVFICWIELKASNSASLSFAAYDSASHRWGPARVIAEIKDENINRSEAPQLAVGARGKITAMWSVKKDSSEASIPAGAHHLVSISEDGGATWSRAAPLTAESDSTEFASLTTVGDGRIVAAWLDGRERSHGGPQALYARTLGEPADVRIDDRVCDCCQTALAAFADGSALLAYRGRTEDEVRDIQFAQLEKGQWRSPRLLNPDGWKIAGCPVNGPAAASNGGRAVVAWYTIADGQPQMRAALSTQGGGQFLQPLRIDDSRPLSGVSAVMLQRYPLPPCVTEPRPGTPGP